MPPHAYSIQNGEHAENGRKGGRPAQRRAGGRIKEVKVMREMYWTRRRDDVVLVLKRGVERGELPKRQT
jgi:hypothetical protein